jgi:ketosteroid isomerase-like protein
MTAKRSIEGVLMAVLDGFNRHDLDAILEDFADDAIFESPRGPEPYGTRYVGKDEVRIGLAKRFAGIPDVHYGDDRHFVSADGTRGASEWSLTGTTTDGQRLEVRGCDLWTLRDGKIVVKDSYWKRVE